MSGHPNLDLAAAAVAGVGAADQLAKGLHSTRNKHEKNASEHYVKAAVSAAVAIGALELLRRDKAAGGTDKPRHRAGAEDVESEEEEAGHTRKLAEEVLGAYSLGQELLGKKKHHVAHLVMEALGGLAAFSDMQHHSERHEDHPERHGDHSERHEE